jgi:predicted RNA-binding protein with RPS1 domain
MSAVSEDVVTSEQTAAPAAGEAPESVAQAASPAPETNGVAPAAGQSSANPLNNGLPAAAPAPPVPQAAPRDEKPMSQSDFESMFKELAEGDVVVGTVVHIDKDGVLVDVGSKSEGIIRPNELSREPYDNIEDVVQVNEPVKVVVIGRTEEGQLLLSKKRADFEKAWDKVIEALNSGVLLHAMVTERVKGGLVVDLGIRGFVPASHVGSGDFKHQNLDKYVGQSIALKVIEVDRDRRKVVLSNREATEDERRQRKEVTLASLKEGEVRKGIVRRVTDYGAFIDLGGIDGLLHVSEMSWSRVKHPNEVLKNGQELDVMILKLRLDQGRISLGLRQILPDPWTQIGEKYNVGDVVKVEVSRLVPFGAFVELEEGVEAIIPTSELAERRIAKPSDAVNPGEIVEARIIEMRTEERKMTLSIRRMVENAAPQPYVPEPDLGGRGGERGGRGGERGGRDGRPIVGEREGGVAPAPPRDRPRRERSGGGGGGRGRDMNYGGDSEDDYKEFKNYRANQREETFGTSLADVFGKLGADLAEAEPETEAKADVPTEGDAEKE